MNTGLLGFFQQDPDKQEALRQGLLNAGIAMMAGGRQDLGTAVGQGMGAGVGIYRQQIEDLKRRQAQMADINAARGPRPQMPKPGMQAPNMGMPQPAQPAMGQPAPTAMGTPAPMGQPAPAATVSNEAPGPMAAAAPVAAPEQEQAQQMDMLRYLNFAAQNPDNPDREVALSALARNAGSGADSMFGKVMPHLYTPESLARFQQTGSYQDLVPNNSGAGFGKINPSLFTPESLARYEQSGEYSDLVPFRAPTVVNRGGQIDVIDQGSGQTRSLSVVPKLTETPEYIARQAAAETAAKERTKIETGKEESRVAAASNLPRVTDSANITRKMVTELLNHPAFSSSVGFTWTPGAQRIPGTPQADFQSRIDQLKGNAFLEAFTNLKGGGSITEQEGKKAEAAINRMSTSTSEAEFRQAAKDFLDVVDMSERRAKTAAGVKPAAIPRFGEVRNGYRYIGGVNSNPKDKKNWQKVTK